MVSQPWHLALGSLRIDSEETFHGFVGFAEDDVEGLQASVVDEAIAAFRIDREDSERVIEEHGVSGWIREATSSRFQEKSFDLPRVGGRAVILRLGDAEGHEAVPPADDGR